MRGLLCREKQSLDEFHSLLCRCFECFEMVYFPPPQSAPLFDTNRSDAFDLEELGPVSPQELYSRDVVKEV